MDDFDGDDLLDIAVTSMDTAMPMAYYHNQGDGTFEDRSKPAGVTDQLGGLVCYQTDYNNDGRLDIFIPRGAWLPTPFGPSAAEKRRRWPFHATSRSRPGSPSRSIPIVPPGPTSTTTAGSTCSSPASASPTTCIATGATAPSRKSPPRPASSRRTSRVIRGPPGSTSTTTATRTCFSTALNGNARLYHNNRDGTFSDVTTSLGIDGPHAGFSCWAWDYDNDGWLDIFATSYDRSLGRRCPRPAGPAARRRLSPPVSQPERDRL